ncbi:hypothetical protein LTR35_017308 [Friedmanniomyces endolithicus]|nr:hypothetical protein LTS09_017913 [Friedmanniomyces endolithicus]KAK0264613.1 hypothetical protein LTR35_017308 [Friedmanniomyces endolithicus]KAK0270614.1 hypothetical protein LTS00_016896 [Friedmanniomyces endolithicus]KAK0302750.1 hypothetical protein LTR01_008517 [Friedmanniomyces endolithicus]KAK0823294.1 hypothetical protein LTR73_008609 [Friedmanniomyces endolithicus]
MAVTFTHPLDQTKYRMQVMQAPKAMLRTLIHVASRDGIRSLWTGLTASYARQLSYSTARFGLYNYFAGEMRKQTGKQRLSISMEIMSSGFAGGLAGFIGNPSEVYGAKAPAQRFGYRNVLDAFVRITRAEGFEAFSRGLTPNVIFSGKEQATGITNA